jgi:RNA polymerase sigma-70 factor (ECF subfamily)
VSVTTLGLEQTMRAAGSSVKVVVLNACFTEVQAQAIVGCVPSVVGMSGAIGDHAARVYAEYFYNALACGSSVKNAYLSGLAALTLNQGTEQARDVQHAEPIPGEQAPRLLTRSDTDADSVHIVRVTTHRGSAKARTNERVQYALTIDGTLEECDESLIAQLTAELCRICKDLSIKIVRIEKSSIKLTISLPPQAAKRLMEARANGELEQLCGYTVYDVGDIATADSPLTAKTRLAKQQPRPSGNRQGSVRDTVPRDVMDKLARQPARRVSEDGFDPDQDIAELIARGAVAAALHALMERHGVGVYRYCRSALRDQALADDVHQQVFLDAFRDLHRFRGRSTLRTWLFSIARNRVLDTAKARRRRQARSDFTRPGTATDPSPLLGRRLHDERLDEALASSLDEIDPDVRTAVLLHFQQGFTFEEIATITGGKAGTLQMRVARALPVLSALIQSRTGSKS